MRYSNSSMLFSVKHGEVVLWRKILLCLCRSKNSCKVSHIPALVYPEVNVKPRPITWQLWDKTQQFPMFFPIHIIHCVLEPSRLPLCNIINKSRASSSSSSITTHSTFIYPAATVQKVRTQRQNKQYCNMRHMLTRLKKRCSSIWSSCRLGNRCVLKLCIVSCGITLCSVVSCGIMLCSVVSCSVGSSV